MKRKSEIKSNRRGERRGGRERKTIHCTSLTPGRGGKQTHVSRYPIMIVPSSLTHTGNSKSRQSKEARTQPSRGKSHQPIHLYSLVHETQRRRRARRTMENRRTRDTATEQDKDVPSTVQHIHRRAEGTRRTGKRTHEEGSLAFISIPCMNWTNEPKTKL